MAANKNKLEDTMACSLRVNVVRRAWQREWWDKIGKSKRLYPIGSGDSWEGVLFILWMRLKIFLKHFGFVCRNVRYRKFRACYIIKYKNRI